VTAVALEGFFAEMSALLSGQRSAAACEAVLGPSPSGTERLALYVKLVERQHQAALDSLFRAALVAAATWDRARTNELRASFFRAVPPAHWSPATVAAPFAAYLAAQGAPADVVELADFALVRHEVLRAPLSDAVDGLAVRHYTHAVREFTLGVDTGEITAGRPAPTASTWLLARHRATAELVLIVPSLATLVALQVIADGAWSPELPPVARSEVAEAAQFLFAQGVLAERGVEIVRACV
jgi:hypothetical protein